MQRRRSVQQNRMLADNLVQDVPDLRAFLFNQLFRLFHGAGQALGLQPRIDERLEQLQRHLLGQAALMQLQLRAGHDNRTARKVDALAKKVLTEAALFALQHVRQRFQRALVGARDDAAATAVVKQRVHSFLKHALFVAHDDVWRAQLDQPLQTVVAVDDATVKVVEVRGRKAAPVQRHQRAQFRRNHRQNRQDHPLRAVAGFEKAFDDLQALDDLLRLQLSRGFLQLFAQLLCGRIKVDRRQHFADGFGTDVGRKGVSTVKILGVEILFFAHQLAVVQVGQTRLDHHIVFEVENTLKIAQRGVQHQADTRRQRLEKPDMRNRCCQFDMAHTLAADLLQRDFHTTFFADHAAIFHALVFAAKTFIVFDRAKDARTEQTVTFWLERTVVDGFRLLDLTI